MSQQQEEEQVIIEIVGSEVKVTVRNHGGRTCLDITRDFLTEINGGDPVGENQLKLTDEYHQQQQQTQATRNVTKRRQS